MALIRRIEPKAVICGHSPVGADLAPRLAFRLESAVVTGCIDAGLDGGTLRLTRPCYGGKANEVVSVKTSPVVMTAKAKYFGPAMRDDDADGTVEQIQSVLDPATVRTKVREVRRDPGDGVMLENARGRSVVAAVG